MELNSKKLERTSRIVYYSISVILCFFLIALSNTIIGDLDEATSRPTSDDFINSTRITELEKENEILAMDQESLISKRETIEKTIAIAKENYRNEKQSFDNWVQTRKTLGSPNNDQEVIDRASKLDTYYEVEQDWRQQMNLLQEEIDGLSSEQQEVFKSIDKEHELANEQYEVAYEAYNLKVFLFRLLFVGPILLLGIYFFIRFRNHKFWPLFFAFTLFSIYAFFFGLVPYLPSYGGYIRYTVGVIISAGLGYYAIKSIRKYLDEKKAELKISTEERANKVETQVAEKALENHFCPSCGKDFILKKWEFPLKVNETTLYQHVTDFCRHCGLELFSDCKSCGQKNFAHLPFCSSCGKVNRQN
jgi:predicted RNA-binding Zn-ribbon protein involved in translation (DUF1610 family)